MKNLTKIMLFGIACISACQSQIENVDLSGVYVHQTSGEYSVADDTLRLTRTGADHYIILRVTGYRAIRDGKLLPKKLKQERLEGDFDVAPGVLNETMTGRIFRFDPNRKVLLLKQAVYRKL